MSDEKIKDSEKTITETIAAIRITKERLKETKILLDQSRQLLAVYFYPTQNPRTGKN